MESLYIVMPAYNEEANIEAVVNAWYPILKMSKSGNSRLVIADSGSEDSTHEILLNMQKTYTQLEILSDTEKQHGPKVIALYDYAVRQGADYIFQTDSDGQTDPREFKKFWAARDKYDIIIGHRHTRGDGRLRAFVERIVCIILHIIFAVKVPDANAPFRLMKAEVLKKYLYRLPPDYNLPNIMLTAYWAYYKENLCFKPISFKPRQGGINSINISKIVKIGWKALGDFWRFRKQMRKEKTHAKHNS